MNTERAIVLLSGGMDSLASAAMAREIHSQTFFLHVSYGQKSEERERHCFEKITDFYNIPRDRRKLVKAPFLKEVGGSSLTDDSLAVTPYRGSGIPVSYVPFRNTHLIAMAVSWAEVRGAKFLYIGAVQEDSSGYPDCRPSYYEAYNKLIEEGTKEGSIRIVTPVIHMKKHAIIQKIIELKAPVELTYSCYARNDKACGVCDSCALRLRGFQEAGLPDPIDYVVRPRY